MGQVVIPRGCDPQSKESLDALISLTVPCAGDVEREARYLLDKIDKILDAKTWPSRLRGKPKTWERFCSQVLGHDSRYFDEIREGVAILGTKGVSNPTVGQAREIVVAARAESTARLAANGGDRKSDEAVNQPAMSRLKYGSTNADYLTARIARDRPDILERMKAGEFRSVRQAGLEAGIVKPKVEIPLDPEAAGRVLVRHFQGARLEALFKAIGKHRVD